MKQTLPILLMLCLGMSTLRAEEPPYSLESTSGVLRELSKEEHKQPIKEWLRVNRPQQYERLFGEKKAEAPKEDSKDNGSLFAALADLSAAVADPQVAMLDYYINQKAKQGWHVVSFSEKSILFRRRE